MNLDERSVPEEKRRRDTTRNVAEVLLIYAGIPTATMYPLGLLVLWIQISYFYGETFAASWVAANLVPRTALMGIGAAAIWDLLLTQLLHSASLGIIVLGIVLWTRRMRRAQRAEENPNHITEDKEELNRRKAERENLTEELQRAIHIPLMDIYWLGPRWVLGVLILILLFQVLGWVPVALQGQWAEVGSRVLFLMTILATLYISGRDGYKAEHNRISKYWWFLRGLSVAFVGVLCTAVLHSGIGAPALPEVLLDAQGSPTEAAFLAHEGRYWYVFGQDNSFRAIPDDETGEVEFIEPHGV